MKCIVNEKMKRREKNDDDDSVEKREIRRWKENDQGGKV